MTAPPTRTQLEGYEELAAELSYLAGAEIEQSLGREIAVRYKGGSGTPRSGDPVSEVDHHVETLIRARIGEVYPDHHIIGEEFGARGNTEHPVVWAIDPIDGTSNFINGLPVFAASIGVLVHGAPVAGALWCASTHVLRPGVYSAHRGGALRFDGADMVRRENENVYRRLVGVPRVDDPREHPFDTRKTGSAAAECAFVAAGLMAGATFAQPFVWDIAGGVVLVEAAGGVVRTHTDGAWRDLASFRSAEGTSNTALAHWRQPVAVGEREAVDTLIAQMAPGHPPHG